MARPNEEYLGVLAGHYRSAMLTLMIDLGHRTGLFAAAAQGPATSEELAARAGLSERHVREWLGAMATGGGPPPPPARGRPPPPPPRAALFLRGNPPKPAPLRALVSPPGPAPG